MTQGVPTFTSAHAALLRAFLAAPQRPQGTLRYPQLAGFLFSLANGPELIPPSEWIPMVFNDQDGMYETNEEAARVLDAMMALYNDCVRAGQEGRSALPLGCEIRPQVMDNVAEEAPLSQWAQGFSLGHDYLVNLWEAYTPEEFEEDLGALLMALTFFASPRLAQAYHQETTQQMSLAQFAESVVEVFPEAMSEYAHLGRAIYQARLEAGDHGPPPGAPSLAPPKIGRNDPCPCGSGKTFKKCCGAN